jgi:hypothetical protein
LVGEGNRLLLFQKIGGYVAGNRVFCVFIVWVDVLLVGGVGYGFFVQNTEFPSGPSVALDRAINVQICT